MAQFTSTLQIRMTSEQRDAIDGLADRSGVPVAWLTRWLIDQGLVKVLPQGEHIDGEDVIVGPPRISEDQLLELYVDERTSGVNAGSTE